jgi:hypothetical protein
MAGTFNFASDRHVPETLPPEPIQTVSMNGWTFAAKPKIPYVRKFRLTLYGMRWYLQAAGLYDTATNPTFNARLLEQFYQANGTWDNFSYTHPHIGPIQCRFASAVTVPAAIPNSGGLIDAFQLELIEHDPGF